MNKTKRMENNGRSSMGTGTTSLLMIFTVLCFATLALLSLSTANSNRNIQKRNLAGTTAQAFAEGEAAAALAQLDAALDALDGEAEDWETQALAIAKEQGWAQSGSNSNQITCLHPVAGSHEMATTILLENTGGANYRLLAQTTQYTGEWAPDPGMQVWTG